MNQPIDAVILWVDGNDENHRNKMLPYVEKDQILYNKNFRTRFDQVEEVKYTVDSILKNASWVRNIFLITDSQVPQFLKVKGKSDGKYNNVILVDHRVIFKGYEDYLPTFNSLSIETMMHTIPGLAEHFIYFNDDVFLIKKTSPTDFFSDGLPVIRGYWTLMNEHSIIRKLKNCFKKSNSKNRIGYKKIQQNTAKMVIPESKKYFRFDHTAFSLRKSTFKDFFQKNPDFMVNNIKHRFRNHQQFNLQALANHIEIKKNTCVIENEFKLAYLQSYKKPLLWYQAYFEYFKRNPNKIFLCLQSLDRCSLQKLKFIKTALGRMIDSY